MARNETINLLSFFTDYAGIFLKLLLGIVFFLEACKFFNQAFLIFGSQLYGGMFGCLALVNISVTVSKLITHFKSIIDNESLTRKSKLSQIFFLVLFHLMVVIPFTMGAFLPFLNSFFPEVTASLALGLGFVSVSALMTMVPIFLMISFGMITIFSSFHLLKEVTAYKDNNFPWNIDKIRMVDAIVNFIGYAGLTLCMGVGLVSGPAFGIAMIVGAVLAVAMTTCAIVRFFAEKQDLKERSETESVGGDSDNELSIAVSRKGMPRQFPRTKQDICSRSDELFADPTVKHVGAVDLQSDSEKHQITHEPSG